MADGTRLDGGRNPIGRRTLPDAKRKKKGSDYGVF